MGGGPASSGEGFLCAVGVAVPCGFEVECGAFFVGEWDQWHGAECGGLVRQVLCMWFVLVIRCGGLRLLSVRGDTWV